MTGLNNSSHLNQIQQLCTNLESDVELVVGEIYGLRQWFIEFNWTGHSTLNGHYGKAWNVSGLNVAHCDKKTTRKTVSKPVDARNLTVDRLEHQAARMFDEHSGLSRLGLVDETGREWGALQMRLLLTGRPFPMYSGQIPPEFTARIVAGSEVCSWRPDNDTVSDLFTFSTVRHQTKLRLVGTVLTHDEHRPADPACTCGFYAYTDEQSLLQNSFTSEDCVFGLIRGYGRVTQGTKGFRCENAEIVSLTEPHRASWGGFEPYPSSVSSANSLFRRMVPQESKIRMFSSLDKLLQSSKSLLESGSAR